MALLIYIGLAAAIGAVILTFLSWRWSAAVAIAGLLMVCLGSGGSIDLSGMLFWGAAAALVLVLNATLPRSVATARIGMGYISGGALAGLFIGLLISRAWLVLGCITGAVLGCVAYSRTPAGRKLEFPSSKFIQYLCAKGLPAVVTLSIAAFTILEAIYIHRTA